MRLLESYADVALLLLGAGLVSGLVVWVISLGLPRTGTVLWGGWWLAGFGLLPIWATVALIAVAAMEQPTSREGLAVLPWLFFFTVPASFVTVAIGFVGFLKCGIPGSSTRKLLSSLGSAFLMFVLIATGSAFLPVSNRVERARAREQLLAADAAERAAVRDFALSTPQFGARFANSLWNSGAKPLRPERPDSDYAVYADSKVENIALVAIVGKGAESRFDMRCILPSETYYAWVNRFSDRDLDPCTLDGAEPVD